MVNYRSDSFRTVQPFIRKQYRHSPSAYPELRKARGTIGNVFRIDEGKQVRSDQLQETIIHAMSQPETMADYLHVGLHEMTAKRAITNPTEPNYMKNLGIALIERDRAGVAKYLEPAIDQHVHKIFNPASFAVIIPFITLFKSPFRVILLNLFLSKESNEMLILLTPALNKSCA
mgnify:CR=1 FL=1